MIRIISNPNLKGEEFIDDKFIQLLANAVILNEKSYISAALIYANIGLSLCEDCDRNFYYCNCESCSECRENRCVCKYNITFSGYDDRGNLIKNNSIRNAVNKIAKNTLHKNQLIKLNQLIKNNKYVSGNN